MNKKIFKKGDKPSSIAKAAIATAAVGALSVGTILPTAFLATGTGIDKTINSLFEVAEKGFKAVYKGLLGIATLVAVVICAWCYCVKMFSKNPRSIDEANQWIKRVCIAWLCFMLLSIFVKIGLDVVGASSANTDTPWGE